VIPEAPAEATMAVRNSGLGKLRTGETWCAALIAPRKRCSLVAQNHAEEIAFDCHPAVVCDEV
jgi:hypothetical protein